jgi:alpha-mannosidase
MLCSLLPFLLQAATDVDRLVSEMDSLAHYQLADWKYTVDAQILEMSPQEVSAPTFDLSSWKSMNYQTRLYVDSCWLRTTISFPKTMLGQSLSGSIRLLLSVDDYGYLWVNGDAKGHFPWDGEFVLSENAQPGMKFVILIKAMNTGGPLRLLRAELEQEKSKIFKTELDNLSLSFKVGQKLLGFDTYQTSSRKKYDPGIDRSHFDKVQKLKLNDKLQKLAAQIDLKSLKSGDLPAFEKSVQKIKSQLKEIDRFVKNYTLFFTSNAHIDAAWLWRKAETKEVCKNTFSSVIRMMSQHPDFTYTQSSAVYYGWMQQLYPSLYADIQRMEKQGRWEIIGGSWIEPDCNLINGTSWWRQLLYGQEYFQQNFGKRAKIGWNPDSFGYNWNMPQFYLNSGIDAFITQKIGWNDTSVFPYRLFWWQGPDDSRILAYFPFDYVDRIEDPFRLVDWLRQYEANTGLSKLMILFGVGDHGGGPTPEMLERIDHLKTLDIFPQVEFGTAENYLRWLKLHKLNDIPVWNSELYLEYHRGTFTTQAKIKKYNRQLEAGLTNLEKLACLLDTTYPYPQRDLQEAWQYVLFNQFHDILPGSGIHEIYRDAEEDYQQALRIQEFHQNNILDILVSKINTSSLGSGKPLIVFNPSSWERNDVATFNLERGDTLSYTIFDSEGKAIPSQVLSPGKYDRQIIFKANKVPALGYKMFELRAQHTSIQTNDLEAQSNTIENRFFKVTIDDKTGWVRSIYDKVNKRDVLKGAGNELQLFDDRPAAWDAWNLGLGARHPSKFRGFEIIENGPVRVCIRMYHDFLHPKAIKEYPTKDFPQSFFIQDVILYSETPRIDFVTQVDWWQEHMMLKVGFPVTIQNEQATYEIPYATVQRPTHLIREEDKGKIEVPALRWADLSKNGYGVSLLNESKYGYDIKGNVMRLSLLRAPTWPDPMADRGKHTIRYAIYPHSGSWQEAQTVLRGYEFNEPLLVKMGERGEGELPLQHSFVQIDPSSIILSSIKKAEDGSNCWVLQLYESSGNPSTVQVILPRVPTRLMQSNFLEDNLLPMSIEGKIVKFEMKKYEIKTIKIYWEK